MSILLGVLVKVNVIEWVYEYEYEYVMFKSISNLSYSNLRNAVNFYEKMSEEMVFFLGKIKGILNIAFFSFSFSFINMCVFVCVFFVVCVWVDCI